jgi:hypothetical protein
LEKLPPEKRGPLAELAREALHRGGVRVNRHYLGILVEGLTRERAEQVVSEFRALGMETELREMAQLVPNPRAVQLRNADCLAHGLVAQDMYGRERVHPWDTILLLCGGALPFEKK